MLLNVSMFFHNPDDAVEVLQQLAATLYEDGVPEGEQPILNDEQEKVGFWEVYK